MYENTSKPTHTIVNKCSMKALQRFIQLEMKEHDLKVETTKMNQQHVIRFFKEAHPLILNFAWQSQVWMDVMIAWTYLESSSFILFASNLKWLVTKMPEGICAQLCFYAYFTRVSQQKVKTHIIFRKCLLQDKSSSSGNLLIMLLIGEVVSPPTLTSGYLS